MSTFEWATFVSAGRRNRFYRRGPVPPAVPRPAVWPAADLVAESAQREGDGAMAATGLVYLGPPGLGAGPGARLDGEPDPLVFGDPALQMPRPAYAEHSCPCGVRWSGNELACWNCGKPVSP